VAAATARPERPGSYVVKKLEKLYCTNLQTDAVVGSRYREFLISVSTFNFYSITLLFFPFLSFLFYIASLSSCPTFLPYRSVPCYLLSFWPLFSCFIFCIAKIMSFSLLRSEMVLTSAASAITVFVMSIPYSIDAR
jgi:hypothetical protein